MTDLLAVTYSEIDTLAASAVVQMRRCQADLEEEVLPRLQDADRLIALRFIASFRQNQLFASRAAAELDRLLYAIADEIDREPAGGSRDDGEVAALAHAEKRLLVLRNTLETISVLMKNRSASGGLRAAA